MPINLDDFRAIANGKYNAGQIDFETNRQGEVTGLKKVNNHVHMTGKNIVAIDPKRAVEVKEAFIKALAAGGVTQDRLAAIRAKLGIAVETKTSVDGAGDALRRRYTPLSREQVRDILLHDSGLAALPAAADSKKIRNARAAVADQIASLVRKSPPHEQLFALLAGRSCLDSAKVALRSSPDMMKIAAGLRANINDTLFQNAWNHAMGVCLNRQAQTLAALRTAVTAFVANPGAEPQVANTQFGDITLSSVAEEAMNARHLVASIKVGNETLSLDLGASPAKIAERLDQQIAGGAELLGKERLGAMLNYAKSHGGVGENSESCLGRTVAQAILRTFANVGQELLDELDNQSLVRYARDVAKGTAEWTEASIRDARNEALRNKDNVQIIAEAIGEIDGDDDGLEIVTTIVNNANEKAKADAEPPLQNPPQGEPPLPNSPKEEVPPHDGQPLPNPPQEDKFEKLFGKPLTKDAEDIRPGRAQGPAHNPLDDRLASVESGNGEVSAHFKAALRRAEQQRTFNALTLLFERKKDRPADDRAPAVKTGSTDAPKHFEAAMRTEKFTFATAKQPDR